MTELDKRVSFDGSDPAAERRRDRFRLVGRVAAGLAVLAGVAALALVTSTGGSHHVATTGTGPRVGVQHPGPVPPELVFASTEVGYAFYPHCQSQPEGEGCQARLLRTADGGNTWDSVALPVGAPVDPASWQPVQAHNDTVVLSWKGGAAVSVADGSGFKTVSLETGSASSQLPVDGFLISAGTGPMALDPESATAVRFRPDTDLDQPTTVVGTLPNGGVWAGNGSALDISLDGGVSWQHSIVDAPTVVRPPLIGPEQYNARVSGSPSDELTGPAGDGGELPATQFAFTTNHGLTWAPTTIATAPQVNALCTVFLQDGSLLGVAVDGKSLLQLKKGAKAFTPYTAEGKDVPSCLYSGNGLLWGATFDRSFVLATDSGKNGTHWTPGNLSPDTTWGVAIPSPAPVTQKS